MSAPLDVIVIGAGMAGLKAADELVAKDRSVVVLEAKDRVGGRTKRAEVGGAVADLGGQWIGEGHDVLLGEGKRFGIETYEQYDTGKNVMQLFGKLASFTGDVPKMPFLALLELARLQRRWDREMATLPADAPWNAPRAKEWDSQTLESWILANLHTKHAREFARTVLRGALAAEPDQVSYLWFLDALRGAHGLQHLISVKGGGQERKFKGGMQQIAQRLADTLGERVVLNAPVQTIVQTAAGVRVVTTKGEYAARFVIVAAPPANAAHIVFDPPLPAARDGLHQRMPAGAIIKVIVRYKTPFWRDKGFSGQVFTDDTIGVVMDDARDDGAVLLCFVAGGQALEWSAKGREARRARVLASLVKFFGPEAADCIAYEDNDWTAEPYTHGYVGSMPPGVMTRYGHAIREPVGRIHWAGTETSSEWTGYIEGALRSGIRAAAEVAARHNA